jgi:NADH-quinone oxidoreductase subunit M
METFVLQVPWITLTMGAPLLGALLLAFVPSEHRDTHRHVSVVFSAMSLLFSLALVAKHRADDPFPQLTTALENQVWIEALGSRYFLAIDGLNLWLVVLTGIITPLALLADYRSVTERAKEYHVGLLVMQGAIVGAFTAMDALLYFLFWELMLVPMLVLLSRGGPAGRPSAALKFVLYTMAGSALLMSALLYVRAAGGAADFSFDSMMLAGRSLSLTEQILVFGAMASAFLIKVPLFPLHTWSPDTYAQAPGASAAMLSGVMAKVGIYGLLRWAMPLAPDGAYALAPYIAILAVVGIVHGALVALQQTDLRRMLAYSSLSHLGFVVLGVFALTEESTSGAIFQCFAHGITTGGLFMMATFLDDRAPSTEFSRFGGLATRAPLLALFSVGLVLASAAVPGLIGFVGEFMILMGASQSWTLNFGPLMVLGGAGFGPDVQALLFVAVASLGVILGAIYLLVMVQKTFYGPVSELSQKVSDVGWREATILGLLLALSLGLGIFPTPLMERMNGAAAVHVDSMQDGAVEYRADVMDSMERRALRAQFVAARNTPGALQAELGSLDSHDEGSAHEGGDHE